MKKILYIVLVVFLLVGCSDEKAKVDEPTNKEEVVEQDNTNTGYIVDDIKIKKINSSNYEFVYRDETFKVYYIPDMWKIYDSYKITNSNDIKIISQALIDIHPIHGIDMTSYRTAADMAYEWMQHNLAYEILPAGNSFKNSAKDVDLDPKDQGKSLVQMYEDRTGHKLDLSGLIKEKINSSKNS